MRNLCHRTLNGNLARTIKESLKRNPVKNPATDRIRPLLPDEAPTCTPQLLASGMLLQLDLEVLRFGIYFIWFGAQGFGFSVQGLGLRVRGLRFRVWDLGFKAQGLGLRVWGLGFRLWGFGLRAAMT